MEEVKVFDEESARLFTAQGIQTAPNSFSDPTLPVDATCPPPKYFSNDKLLVPLATTKSEYLKGLEMNGEGCLVCTD